MDKGRAGGGLYGGIDVSARELVVAIYDHGREQMRVLANTASGHQQLCSWLGGGRRKARVCLEASGHYSLDVALALAASKRIEVLVLNPRRARRFAESLGERSKTDPVDARVLCAYAQRMRGERWTPPSRTALALRAITRAAAGLTRMRVQEANRDHALAASRVLPACVRQELARHQQYLERAVARLRAQARSLVLRDPELARRFRLLCTIPGVGEASALDLLAELAVLPTTLDARQWTAHAGLDPAHHQSGSSVDQPSRMSKHGNRHLRRALYMPALVALRWDPHLRARYEQLLARGKRKLQAIVALMRKLLHAIFGVLRHHQPYDGARLCPTLAPPPA